MGQEPQNQSVDHHSGPAATLLPTRLDLSRSLGSNGCLGGSRLQNALVSFPNPNLTFSPSSLDQSRSTTAPWQHHGGGTFLFSSLLSLFFPRLMDENGIVTLSSLSAFCCALTGLLAGAVCVSRLAPSRSIAEVPLYRCFIPAGILRGTLRERESLCD